MVDRMTKGQRSHTMSRIRGRDTGPEVILRREMWRQGTRGYRTHLKGVPGSPDIAFLGPKVAVFVDGCFWHRCPKCYKPPSSNVEFWRSKAERNVERDRRADSALAAAGWRVLRVWEHEINANPERVVTRIRDILVRSTGKLHRLCGPLVDQTRNCSQFFDEKLTDKGRNSISHQPVGMPHRNSEHKSVWE